MECSEDQFLCLGGSDEARNDHGRQLRLFFPAASTAAASYDYAAGYLKEESPHDEATTAQVLPHSTCGWQTVPHSSSMMRPQLLDMFPNNQEDDSKMTEYHQHHPAFQMIASPSGSADFYSNRTTGPAAAAFYSQVEDPASRFSALCHEHLFYKVVTPSDVGKLNRLVIPKQHAERCFPLEPSLRKKGRFISFQETMTGKVWWFRYSYWNSSQSYVFTKGWIRFVKENKLKAGDIVSFERGAASREEFYISCRKRPRTPQNPAAVGVDHDLSMQQMFSSGISLSQQDEDHHNEEFQDDEEDDDNVTGSTSSSQTKQHDQTSRCNDRYHHNQQQEQHGSSSSMRLFGVELAPASY